MILRNKKFVFFILTILFLLTPFFSVIAYAEDPTPTLTVTPTSDTSSQQQDLENKIKDLQNKIKESQGQQKTLSSQIGVMNNQITLTQLRVDSTRQQILFIEVEIV